MSGWSRTGAKVAPSRQRWDTPANDSALIFFRPAASVSRTTLIAMKKVGVNIKKMGEKEEIESRVGDRKKKKKRKRGRGCKGCGSIESGGGRIRGQKK